MYFRESPFEKMTEIEVSKLTAPNDNPLRMFGHQRMIETKKQIQEEQVLEPLFVRPLNNGFYEVLIDQCRLDVVKELGIEKYPVILRDGFSRAEYIEQIPKWSPHGIYLHFGIDIYDLDFKKLEDYKKHAEEPFCKCGYVKLTLGEYIERFLLEDYALYESYESYFSMGNPYLFEEDRALEEDIYTMLAKEILRDDDPAEAESKVAPLVKRLKKYPGKVKEATGIDLNQFDCGVPQNRLEIAKIIFFFYMMENDKFPERDIFHLLSKPTMESISLKPPHKKTSDGDIIHHMRMNLRKELPLAVIGDIEQTVWWISWSRDQYFEKLCNPPFWIDDVDTEKKARVDTLISEKTRILEAVPPWSPEENDIYDLSPVATLYLFIIQYQYLGHVRDVRFVNNIKIVSDYDVPFELFAKLRGLARQHVKIEDIESYIDAHAGEIASYIYPRKKITKRDREKIRAHGKKVRKTIEYCYRARPFDRVERNVERALYIVSCLQAILLDSQNETFDYSYPGGYKKKTQKYQVQAVLKGEKEPVDALEIYWTRKIMDHWYANVGLFWLRQRSREFEKIYDKKWEEILSCPSLSGMIKLFDFYQTLLGELPQDIADVECQAPGITNEPSEK